MIKLALALMMCVLSCQILAATTSAAIQGLKSAAGGYTLKSASATAANGKFHTSATIQQAGQTIQMPASASFAANAASFAIGAVRLNPAGLMIGLTAQWLLSEGLQYINGEWKRNIPAGYEYSMFEFSGYPDAWGDRTSTGCDGFRAYYRTNYNTAFTAAATVITIFTTGGAQGYGYCKLVASGNTVTNSYKRRSTSASSVPATEADFSAVAAKPLPDAPAGELVKVLDMPIQTPALDPAPVDSFSAPYLDPITGRMVKEQTRVTPQPTATNPLNVRIEKYQVDAGDVPGQTTAPVAPTKEANISNQPSNIEFPSDYARQGEAQSAADSINNALGPKLDKITQTGADPADPVQPLGSEFDQSFFNGTFANLLGWQLPAHSSQCPTSAFTFNSTSYTVDSHCQLVTNHFSALSAVMSVVWTILALFILLGA